MDIRKVLIFAVLYVVVAQIVHSVSASFSMQYYVDPAYGAVWSKIMMPGAVGAPPMDFFVYSGALAFLTGIIYALAYVVMEKSLPGKGMSRGMFFGVLLFLLSGVPSLFGIYLMVNLPPGLLAIWALVDGLILYLLAGALLSHFLS